MYWCYNFFFFACYLKSCIFNSRTPELNRKRQNSLFTGSLANSYENIGDQESNRSESCQIWIFHKKVILFLLFNLSILKNSGPTFYHGSFCYYTHFVCFICVCHEKIFLK